MVRKKARRTAPDTAHDDSPLVSDDDGLDITFVKEKESREQSEPEIEAISDGESSDDGLDTIGRVFDGEESDSSSDGEANPVGDIPMRWYDGYDHIGYSRDGEKIIPTNRPSALDLAADPSGWRRIYDEKNDEEIVLTHDELKAIARMRAGRYPSGDRDTEDEVIAWSGPVMRHALTSGTEPKRRFLPSRHEARLVVKLVRRMRAGTIRRPSDKANDQEDDELAMYQYDAWANFEPKTREEMTKSERARDIMRVPAPKPPLPTHGESYNPPSEYLPNEEEIKEWNDLDPEDRETPYLPTKHSSLRQVPLYENFIKERFERCLDLYLAVRVIKDQRKTNADDMVPDLPKPRDLRPFPTDVVTIFGPLPSRARSIDVHPSGQWLISGSDDGCVRLWDIATGYMQCSWDLGKHVAEIDGLVPPVAWVGWCPKERTQVFAVAIGYSIIVVGASAAMGVSSEESDIAMENVRDSKLDEKIIKNMEASGISWTQRNLESASSETGVKSTSNAQGGILEESNEVSEKETKPTHTDKNGSPVTPQCPMLLISHPKPLRMCCWHRKGEYIACVGKDSSGGIVAIHRLRHRSTQLPFKKKTTSVQAVRFHPTRPFFLVATMHHVRIYNLALQEMVKTLKPGVSWISSIDVHPSGDHVLVTSYDKRLCWFDLDLSVKPYKTVRNHGKAVRTAKYHPRLPLFADASDDGSSHVFHGMVYDDLTKNALIVPVKRLERCSKIVDSLGVLDLAWHPRLPWLFTSGADGSIQLLTDCS